MYKGWEQDKLEMLEINEKLKEIIEMNDILHNKISEKLDKIDTNLVEMIKVCEKND